MQVEFELKNLEILGFEGQSSLEVVVEPGETRVVILKSIDTAASFEVGSSTSYAVESV